MKRCFAAFIVLAPLWAWAALTPANFHWSCPLEGSPVAQTTVVAVPLDAGVYAATQDDYRDLRIINNVGAEVPRMLEKLVAISQRTVRRPVVAKLLMLRELPENRVEVELELTETNAVADGFSIVTSLRDFQHAVKVTGSADGVAWLPLVQAAPLFDYTRFADVRQLEVHLPGNSCRRFRLEISNVTEEKARPWTHLMRQTGGRDGGMEQRATDLQHQAFRMDRINFWRNELVDGAVEEARREWRLSGFNVERDDKEHLTLVTIPAGGLPLNRLVVNTAEVNFSRQVALQIPVIRNGVSAWQDISQGRLLSIELPGYTKRELTLDFPERRLERARLVVRDGDNWPLAIRTITGSGPIYRALFVAEAGHSYRLLFGNAQLKAPSYDLTSVLAPVRRGLKPVEWRLGPAVENTAYRAAPLSPVAWLNSPWFFGGAVGLMLLVLGVLLFRVAKRVPPHSDDASSD